MNIYIDEIFAEIHQAYSCH